MNWFKNLRHNRTALRTFLFLFVGFVLIQVAGVYIANDYYMQTRHQVSRRQLGVDLVHVIHLSNVLPTDHLKRNIRQLSQRSIPHITLVAKAPPNVPVIQDTKRKSLLAFASRNFYGFHAAYKLKNGQWIVMRGGEQRNTFLLTGFILSELLLLVIVLAFCMWIVERLALPVSEFADAARRFGVDVQAPPMAVKGAADMQEVIQAFNEMQGRIRRLLMDRTQMLAAISHDLRTPITRLQLRIEHLKGSEQYDKAVADLNEMDRMIASILSFARDYARTESMERFDISALLDNICNELEDTGLNVSFKTAEKRVAYFGRMGALKRAFTNLIENAVKYGDQAEVFLVVSDEVVKIKICDQGPGIPEAEFEKVFAPFYRVDPARSPEKSGTGLGLATARDIIRAHGGDIVLHNREGGGLIVLVTLPFDTI